MMRIRIDPQVTHATKISKSALQKVESLFVLMIVVLIVIVVIVRVIAPIVAGGHASSEVFVVSRGDTLVSIADRLDPNANPYPIVARMEVQTHGSLLWPGERIIVPTSRQ
jgi:hypothetical protein